MIKKEKIKHIVNFIKLLVTFSIFVALLITIIDFLKFPECYSTTWRYQLQQQVVSGNKEAVDYYNSRYIANNRMLFK